MEQPGIGEKGEGRKEKWHRDKTGWGVGEKLERVVGKVEEKEKGESEVREMMGKRK